VVEEHFKLETERLTRSWMQYDRATLRDYLVEDVEDPRINVQSILTRHFLIECLFGKRFDALMEHELRFGLVMNWLLGLLKRSVGAGQLHAVLDALLAGKDEAEGLEIPPYISETFASLFLPNYMCDLFSWAPVETTEVPIPEYLMSTFQMIWREVLAGEQSQLISVLEPACGSAKQMFPEAYFKVGNVLEIEAGEGEFDYCFVHDLFEHLSIEAMEAAIAEICRVTRKGICAGFFNMQDGERHIVRPVGDYYWNNLSMIETKAIFERHASAVQVIHVDTFLWSKFRCGDTHNKGAYVLVISI